MFRRRRVNKSAIIMAVPSVFFLFLSIFGFSAPAKALTPVFESTAAAKVTLGSLASRTQCAALGKQGIGPYTMTGTDATSGDSYSYVTDKNYTREQQLYEGQEATTQNLSYSTSTGESYSGRNGVIRLFSSGSISYANSCNSHGTYGSAFGPEIWTEPFFATANQSISFDWAAAGGGDDYEAYGYLVEVSASGNTYDYGSDATSTLVSYGRGQNQGWVTSSGTVPSTGYYRFRFVNGSYDATGGQVLGAAMYIDSAISVASANTITFAQPSDIVTSSSNQTFTVSATATSGLSITFTSSTTGKCTVGSSTDSSGTSTATVTVLASQTGTCTISANSSANNSYVAAATVSRSFTLLAGATAPTTSGGTSMSGTVEYGETLTAVDGTWGDGGSAVTATTYQWQSCTPSSCTWVNISGATSSTYVIGLDDVAKQIRVAVTKTNSIGSLTANSSASITVPALTSAIVTNLSDTSDSGSLRWAITTANASATINTITFASGNTGTITLASDLPAITEGVTITGTGITTTIIDGDNLYRAIYNNGSRTIVVQDMTFKQGKNVSWNGGLIYNGYGTMTFNRIKISNHSSWAFYQGGGGVTTFNNSQFNNNGYAITSDHGDTPSSLSLTDTNYSNRIYINNSVFTSNQFGIRTERFTKVVDSQFTSNTYGAMLNGLNRQQVINSTFTSNNVGVYLSSWIPTSWTPGSGNQTISGSTFNGNTNAIYFANSWDSGSTTYNGVSANSFSTSTGNTFGTTAVNAANYSGTGYVANGDTIVAPYFNAVRNLTATANNDGSVFLDWDAPTSSNTAPYMYNISFYDLVNGQETSGWGVWTYAANTSYTLGSGMWAGTTGYGPVRFKIQAGTAPCVGEANGSCLYGPQASADATVIDSTTVTTATSSTTTTTTTTVPYQPVPDSNNPGQSDNGGGGGGDSSPTGTTEPPYITPEPETESTTVTLPTETLPETEQPVATIPEESEPTETTLPLIVIEPTEPETVEVDNPWDNSTELPEEFNDLPDNASAEDIAEVITDVDFTEISDGDFENTVDVIFDNLTEAEDVAEVLGSFLDADISDEQFEAVLDKVFGDISDTEQVAEVLTSLLSETLEPEQLVSVMEAVFSEEASVDQMGAVVGDLLEADLSGEELAAVFDAVFDDDLSDEETIELAQDILKGELDAEEFGTVINAIFDEVVTDEVLIETFTAVLETELDAEKFSAIVDVLESDVISKEQVSEVVTLIIEQEGGVDAEQATELATSSKVLKSIDGEQAAKVFDAVVASEVSPEDGAEIVEAVQEAPTEVKEAFEEEINVFAGVFDTYVAIGSSIDVGTRRSVIAVNLVTSTVALASATGAIPTPGSNPTPSNPRQEVAARREEEESEEGGAIEGEGPDWIKSISIYKYENGVRTMDWKNFTKKFIYGVMGSGFTLAGAVVMYFTLSGLTQQIALWGTLIAFTCAMYLHMKEPEN